MKQILWHEQKLKLKQTGCHNYLTKVQTVTLSGGYTIIVIHIKMSKHKVNLGPYDSVSHGC